MRLVDAEGLFDNIYYNVSTNDKVINLIQDQFAHIMQIIWTWFLCL